MSRDTVNGVKSLLSNSAPKLKKFQKDEIRVKNELYVNDYFKNNPGNIEKFFILRVSNKL